MAMEEKSTFATSVGIAVAVIGLIGAIIGLLTAMVTHNSAVHPVDTAQHNNLQPSSKSDPLTLEPKVDLEPTSSAGTGDCYLDGDWVIGAKGASSEEEDYPVRFEHNSLVFYFPQGVQVATPCTVSRNAITLQKPDSAQAGVASIELAVMPSRYEREAAGIFVGQQMGMTWTFRLR